MGFLDVVSDFAKPILSAAGSYFGGPVGGAIGSAAGGLFEDDPSFPMGDDSVGSGVGAGGDLLNTALGFLSKNAGSLFSGASAALPYFMTTEAQRQVNETNKALAAENRQWGSEMQDKQFAFNQYLQDHQMQTQGNWLAQQNTANDYFLQRTQDFSERMSNTQWQRSVEDMKAAGLSPMLAYMKGPAGNVSGGGVPSTGVPSGSSASVSLPSSAAARVESGVPAAMQSAYQMATLKEQLQNMQAQNRVLESEANLKNEQAKTVHLEGDLADARRVWTFEDVKRVVATTGLTDAQKDRVASEITRNIRAGNWDEVRRQALELELPELVTKANAILHGPRGYYAPYIRDVQSFFSSGADAARGYRAFQR